MAAQSLRTRIFVVPKNVSELCSTVGRPAPTVSVANTTGVLVNMLHNTHSQQKACVCSRQCGARAQHAAEGNVPPQTRKTGTIHKRWNNIVMLCGVDGWLAVQTAGAQCKNRSEDGTTQLLNQTWLDNGRWNQTLLSDKFVNIGRTVA